MNPRFKKSLRRTKSGDSYRATKLKKASMESRRAWADFLDQVADAKARLKIRENEECWFRGQKEKYTLTSSLFRLLQSGFNEKDSDPKSIYEIEYDLYFESSARSPDLQQADLTSWDVLGSMRHYGLPTRLLDWTERLGVAVFFALERGASEASGGPSIWLLNPYRLNEIGLGDRDIYSPKYLGYDSDKDEYWSYEDYLVHAAGYFDWDLPAAIYPAQKNQRMRSQMGWFTIWGEDSRDLDQQCPECVRQLVIDEVAIPAAQDFLADAGIDYSTIYPDLDGFARMLKVRYGLNPP